VLVKPQARELRVNKLKARIKTFFMPNLSAIQPLIGIKIARL